MSRPGRNPLSWLVWSYFRVTVAPARWMPAPLRSFAFFGPIVPFLLVVLVVGDWRARRSMGAFLDCHLARAGLPLDRTSAAKDIETLISDTRFCGDGPKKLDPEIEATSNGTIRVSYRWWIGPLEREVVREVAAR